MGVAASYAQIFISSREFLAWTAGSDPGRFHCLLYVLGNHPMLYEEAEFADRKIILLSSLARIL